jgi:LmbE family N-acetylglucosaminyl deacetylase
MIPTTRSADALPTWASVLAVVAHPDDESYGLGAILNSFTTAGAVAAVLSLTHGEASTVQRGPGELAALRKAELARAAGILGVTRTTLHNHPEGRLAELPGATLATDVRTAARRCRTEGLLVFDTAGVTGHSDHAAATAAALLAAEALDLPVLGWTLPAEVAARLNRELDASFIGHPEEEIDLRATVDRSRQLLSSHVHESQALHTTVLWRRLELLGDSESLRWLRVPIDETVSP